MLRRILTILSLVSLVATLALFAMSYWSWSADWFDASNNRWVVFSLEYGAVYIYLQPCDRDPLPGAPRVRWGRFTGLGIETVPMWHDLGGAFWGRIPLLYFVLVFAILPLLWLLPFYRVHRRRLEGRCVRCGYYLRGLPERRCPECGKPF